MIYNQAIKVCKTHLLPIISELYGLKICEIKSINAHEGGRNLVYGCGNKIIRIAFLKDRSYDDFLAETEYVRYLAENGGGVSNVVNSQNGNMVEKIIHDNHTFYICVFEKAKGKQLAENGYQYRESVPISEYYYNCGKVLGKLHQLSKEYTPKHRRYSFFDKFNTEYIGKLIPDSLPLLKEKMFSVLDELEKLDKDNETYGMIHFDYSDGNYNIDFETGQITVYDFDNCCFGWYLYDLANLWMHGVGWIQFEPDPEKRKAFMDDYFNTVLEGYRSETALSGSMLDKLQLFIKAIITENIVDEFEVARNNSEPPECDEIMGYLAKCLEDDIPYKGFFSEIYLHETPFEHEEREI